MIISVTFYKRSKYLFLDTKVFFKNNNCLQFRYTLVVFIIVLQLGFFSNQFMKIYLFIYRTIFILNV